MARKPNLTPSEINTWLSRIKHAEHFRNEADKKFGYSRALLQYQNDFASAMPSFMSNVDLVPINEVYAFAKTFVPSVYSRDPYIAVNPKGYRSIAGAKINELMVNATWRDLRIKKDVKRCIIDAIHAEGWIKLGYTSVFGDIEPPEGKPGLEVNQFIRSEEIFCTRVSWRNMVRDPDAIDGIADARFVAQQIIKPLAAFRASSLYENTQDMQPAFIVKNTAEEKARRNSYQFAGEDEVEYGCAWEIWDMDMRQVYTISEGCSKYLMNKKWPYEFEGYPFGLLRFNINPDEAYAMNLIGSWEPQLWEKIKLRAMELDHIKRFNRQLSIEDGAMTNAEMQKLTLGKTGSITKRKKGFAPPEPITYPPIQSDIYAIENKIDLDKDNISGQPNAVRSAPQRTQSRTLGEVDRLISSFTSRQSEPQGVIEDFCEDIAYKIIGLTEQFLDGEKYVRATQKDIEEIQQALIDPKTKKSRFDGVGFTFTKEDIQDVEYDVECKAGSTLPMDKENRLQTLSTLLKLGPTIGIQPGGTVARALGKSLISEFELKEVEAAFDEETRQINAQKQLVALQQKQNADAMTQKVKDMKALGPGAMPQPAPMGADGGGSAVQ